MRVLSIIGTRPEALKLGPVLRRLALTPGMESLICTTGQHGAILKRALALFELRPDYCVHLGRRGPAPDMLAGLVLLRLGPLVERLKPDWILAVGDTTSVLCAGLVATHHRVRFGHVEAGLRSGNRWHPFPEESNRRIASVLAELHFAPTAQARRNLLRENIPARQIVLTGNPVIDTLRQFSRLPASDHLRPLWRRLGLHPRSGAPPRLLTVTFHRRENIGPPMREICAALRDIARIYQGTVRILCLVHPNPAVRALLRADLSGVPHLVLSRPLDYPSMIAVLRRSFLLLTDSGGLQEEAPYLRIPVLVLRDCTERPEGIAAGVAQLCGTSHPKIVASVRHLLDCPSAHRAMSRGFAGYGDGHAARRIVQALQHHR